MDNNLYSKTIASDFKMLVKVCFNLRSSSFINWYVFWGRSSLCGCYWESVTKQLKPPILQTFPLSPQQTLNPTTYYIFNMRHISFIAEWFYIWAPTIISSKPNAFISLHRIGLLITTLFVSLLMMIIMIAL